MTVEIDCWYRTMDNDTISHTVISFMHLGMLSTVCHASCCFTLAIQQYTVNIADAIFQ